MKDNSFFMMVFSHAKILVMLPPSTSDFCKPRSFAANYLTSKILLNCSLTGVVHTTRETSACTTVSIYLGSTSAGALSPASSSLKPKMWLKNAPQVFWQLTNFFSCLAQEVLNHYIHLNGVSIESHVQQYSQYWFFFLLPSSWNKRNKFLKLHLAKV